MILPEETFDDFFGEMGGVSTSEAAVSDCI